MLCVCAHRARLNIHSWLRGSDFTARRSGTTTTTGTRKRTHGISRGCWTSSGWRTCLPTEQTIVVLPSDCAVCVKRSSSEKSGRLKNSVRGRPPCALRMVTMLTRSRHAVVPASGPLADDGNQGGVRAAVPHARVLRRGTSLCVVDSPLTQALRVHRITTRIWAQNEELRDRAKKWRSAKHKKYGVRQERVSRVFFDHMDRDRDGYWVECVGPCAL